MIPLYVKTTYTFMTSLIAIDDLINFGLKNHYNSLVIADDNLYGTMEFIKKCQSNSIKPVIGLDLNNIVLYSKNYSGYQNLLKLVTLKSTRQLTIEDYQKYKDDLIAIVPFSNYNNITNYSEVFNEIYVGYSNKDECKRIDNNYLKVYFKKHLCLDKEAVETLKYLHMLRDNKTVNDEYIFDDEVYYTEFSDSTVEDIIGNCNIVLPKYTLNLPNYVKYNDTKGLSSDEYLYNLSVLGLNKRLNNNITESYKKRLLYELDVIKKMNFSNYFLIVYDYIKYAKTHNILVGPGRGSGASSLVSYSLGITEVDPLKYDLLFERFLNMERITMPDIDTDFPDNRRDDVTKYVIDKYGLKQVSGVITFGTFGSKMAIRDIGRVMNIPLYTIDEICRLIGNSHESLASIYNNNFKLKGLVDCDSRLKKLYNVAMKIEGNVRHTSVHAAGIIMCDNELDDIVPLIYNDNMYICGYEANYLEELGLLKMDFLGLRNLTTIDNTLKMINEYTNDRLLFNDIPLEDDLTNKIFQNGDTLGIFQFESHGMQNFLIDLKPTCFMDIVNANAFFRPGPSDSIDSFIKRRHGLENIDYFDDSLKSILASTCGIMVYQEQIMQVASTMAGYTLGESDILRRAMSKKKLEAMEKEKERFISGSIKRGYSNELANKVFNLILQFASYGFNKSHSVAYSMVAYKMAYLKAHYAIYFYVALLNSVTLDSIKTNEYIKEIKKYQIRIMKPDINYSNIEYSIYQKQIVLPFTLINGISSTIAKKIIEAREMGFDNIYDFFSKAISNGLTKNNIESLIDSGSLDNFNFTRQTLYHNIDNLINYGSLTKDLGSQNVLKPEIEETSEFSKDILIAKEKEIFGFYLTNHPVSLCKAKENDFVNLVYINNYFNKTIKTIVMIDQLKVISTKKGEKMCFMKASDEESSGEYVLFPKVYSLYDNLVVGDIVKVVGRVEKQSSYQIIVQSIEKENV